MGNSQPKPTLKEQVRKHKRDINRAIRELDRERTGLERQQQKIQKDIRKAAKEGQNNAMKIMAKDYVRTKRYIEKFYQMRTQLQGVSLRLQTIQSQQAMTDALKGATKAMVKMGRQMNLPQMQNIARTFAMESERMDMTQEIMDDTVDDVMEGSEDEEEEDALVDEVIQELNLNLMENVPSAPAGGRQVGAEAPAAAAPIGMGGDHDSSRGDGSSGRGGGGSSSGGGGGGGAAAPVSGSGPSAPSGGGGGAPELSELEARLSNLRG